MNKVLAFGGQAVAYTYSGLFWTSLLAQVLVGMGMVAVIILGLAHAF